MIKLPLWTLNQNKPSVYDTESATCIEMVAKLYGAMQELIDEYNGFATNVNKLIEEFTTGVNNDNEVFRTALRQEFQDFIDTVAMEVQSQDNKIDEAVRYMKDKIVSTTQTLVINALANEEITAKTSYNAETEELNFIFTEVESDE